MKVRLVAAARLALLSLYSFFGLFPQRRRIVCLSRESDTAPVDFTLLRDCFAKERPDIEVVILAKRMKSPVTYAPHVIRQLYYMATSGAVLLDTYAFAVSLLAGHIKVPVIQMWHGLGNMKKFGYTALGEAEGRSASVAKLLNMHRGYSSLLISADSFIDDYAAGFDVSPDLIHVAPLPRVDRLIDPSYRDCQRERILAQYPQLAEKKNIVYCPTFRKQPSHNQRQAWDALAQAVDFSRYNLILKSHPLDATRFADDRVLQDYPKQYDMLFIADYVISDYSTVIYEAGLLGIPVFLYGYDWNEYSTRRSLYIDPAKDVPTLFTDDPKAIVAAIEHDDFDEASYQEFVRRNVALPEHGSCTEQVMNHVLEQIRESRLRRSSRS